MTTQICLMSVVLHHINKKTSLRMTALLSSQPVINIRRILSVVLVTGNELTYLFSIGFSAVIGEIDNEMDKQVELSSVRAEPLNAVVH